MTSEGGREVDSSTSLTLLLLVDEVLNFSSALEANELVLLERELSKLSYPVHIVVIAATNAPAIPTRLLFDYECRKLPSSALSLPQDQDPAQPSSSQSPASPSREVEVADKTSSSPRSAKASS